MLQETGHIKNTVAMIFRHIQCLHLIALETEGDKIDVDKLKTVPDDLAKLSNVVKNEGVKKN